MKDGIIVTILIIVWTVIKLIFKLIWVIVKILAALFIFFGLYIPLFYGVFGIALLAATDFVLGVLGTDQVLYFLGFGLSCLAAVIISIRNLIVRPISAIFAPFLEYRDDIKKAKEELSGKKEEEQNAQQQNAVGQNNPAYLNQQPYPGYGQPDYMRNAYPQQPYSYGYPSYYNDPRAPYPEADPYAGGYANNYSGNPTGNNAPYYPQMTPHPPYYSDRNAPQQDPYAGRPGQPAYPDPASAPSSVRAPMPERPLIYYSKRRPGVLVKEYTDRFELFEESEEGRRYIGTEYKDE